MMLQIGIKSNLSFICSCILKLSNPFVSQTRMMMRAASILQKKNSKLPNDIETEIQLRLPPKSLFRFKSVSKSWENQISDPHFQDMYHKRSEKSPNLLLLKSNQLLGGVSEWRSLNTTNTISLTNIFNTKIKISNMMVTPQGMICFLGIRNHADDTKVFLYSIITKKLIMLPMDSSTNYAKGPILGFGIGYLPCINKFKVCLLFTKIKECFQVFPDFNCQVIEISSSSNGDGSRYCSSWRLVKESLNDLVACFVPPVFVENNVYWKTWYNDVIICFDIKDEKFGRVNYPNGHGFSATDEICLVELQGKLGLSVTPSICNHHQNCFTMVIWKLQDSVEHIWEKTFIISPVEAITNSLKPLSPIYVKDDGEIVIYSSAAGCLIFYNLEKKTYKLLNFADVDVSFDHELDLVGKYYENINIY